MTSNCSHYEFSFWTLLPCVAILGLWVLFEAPIIFVLFGASLMGFNIYRDHCRRSTLRRRDDGVYVWIEWYGEERSSICDPTDDWDSENDGDGGGDGGD